MIQHEGDLRLAEHAPGFGRERETYEVHDADLSPLLVRASGLEAPDHHVRPHLHAQVILRVDAEETIEHRLDLRRLRDLDHHRGCQLRGPGQELVVDVHFLHDLPVVDDALGPDHLLDLEPHGQAVLEDQ